MLIHGGGPATFGQSNPNGSNRASKVIIFTRFWLLWSRFFYNDDSDGV